MRSSSLLFDRMMSFCISSCADSLRVIIISIYLSLSSHYIMTTISTSMVRSSDDCEFISARLFVCVISKLGGRIDCWLRLSAYYPSDYARAVKLLTFSTRDVRVNCIVSVVMRAFSRSRLAGFQKFGSISFRAMSCGAPSNSCWKELSSARLT
jgi:hypothetical protein